MIELMIVVAIVGILAAIALPAYQDYVVRAKMSEAIADIGACKTFVAEYAATKTAYPANTTASGCSTTVSKYLASLSNGHFYYLPVEIRPVELPLGVWAFTDRPERHWCSGLSFLRRRTRL